MRVGRTRSHEDSRQENKEQRTARGRGRTRSHEDVRRTVARGQSSEDERRVAGGRNPVEESIKGVEGGMGMKIHLVKTAMKKEIERFTSMDPDIKLQILRQAYETRFERLEF
ncbi:hypothetical protein L6452_00987 [Arctium lappa]|uniref:Uncharacterized protein n=1 Tax=Arctium lappa TaxID=4217 RepID=A0ACB9FG18_ARCLA|nr:hypothetical protein L6452_00987 [Arctium lappa]